MNLRNLREKKLIRNLGLSHQMYPKSILAGVYQPQYEVTLNGNTVDTKDQWIYTENFNKGKVYPLFLYDAQLKMRLDKKKQDSCLNFYKKKQKENFNLKKENCHLFKSVIKIHLKLLLT